MKRISFGGSSIVTGNAITAAILEYTTTVADAENSITVDITVLEEGGETSVHTLVLGPGSQFDVVDVRDAGGISEDDEARWFPVPEMPQVGIVGKVEVAGRGNRSAEEFDSLSREIDEGFGT